MMVLNSMGVLQTLFGEEKYEGVYMYVILIVQKMKNEETRLAERCCCTLGNPCSEVVYDAYRMYVPFVQGCLEVST